MTHKDKIWGVSCVFSVIFILLYCMQYHIKFYWTCYMYTLLYPNGSQSAQGLHQALTRLLNILLPDGKSIQLIHVTLAKWDKLHWLKNN